MTPVQDLISQIDRARVAGRTVIVEPPMTPEQLAVLEERCRAPLPPEILDLAGFTSGFALGDTISVDFTGDQMFEIEEIVPRGIPILADGRGNFWVVDVASNGSLGPVLFLDHDPPVVIVQAPDLSTFLGEVFAVGTVEELADSYVAEVWSRNPYILERAEALVTEDDELRAFAQEVSDDFVIADLRGGTVGRGFVWGLAGPETEIKRAGDRLLFAIQRKKPRRSWLSFFLRK